MIEARRPFRRLPLTVSLTGGLMLVGACDPGDAARDQWLHNVVVLDNQVFFESEPELAGGKLAKMDLDLYAYFRGTAGCYARDLAQAGGPGYLPTDFLAEDAADVALIGDPHLENIGTFLLRSGLGDSLGQGGADGDGPAGGDDLLVVDFNDYDAATYGPFHFDVRRLALSAAIASASVDALSLGFAEATAEAPRALTQAYVDEIARLDAGAADEPLTEASAELGTILADLVKKAREKGDAREELSDYTEIVDGVRSLAVRENEPAIAWRSGAYAHVVYDDEIAAVAADDLRIIKTVLEDTYPATVADPAMIEPVAETLRIKGFGRRLGAGVASYPVRRYYVLVEGPTESIADDWILELKQVFDPLVVPGLEQAAGGRPFADNGERVVAMQRGLQGSTENDALLGHGSAGGLTMRVRERTKYQRGVGVDRIAEKSAEGEWSAEDYLDYARWAGRLLARAHARGVKRDGHAGLAAIAGTLSGDGRGAGFVDETVAFVDAYAPVVEDDALRFRGLLASYGPVLGYVGR